MAIARKRQVSLVDTQYYQCISCSVQRAFFGENYFTGQFYEYRKRLSIISWFMRLLDENIACRANKEDN